MNHPSGRRSTSNHLWPGHRVPRMATTIAVLLAAVWSGQDNSESVAQVETVQAVQPTVGAAGHQRMVSLLQEIARRIPDHDPYLGDRYARSLRDRLARFDPSTHLGNPELEKARIYQSLGHAELLLGREKEAIEYLAECVKIYPKYREFFSQSAVNSATFQLAVAYMRRGETQNCVLSNNAESCILPLQGGGVHSNKEGFTRAAEYFTQVLENSPEESLMRLESLWLLNIVHMGIGTYPDGVPREFLIPPSAYQSDEAFPRFVNVASRVGLDTFSQSGGAVVDDFDNDGYLDLIVSEYDPSGQIRYFHNDQDGSFSDRTRVSGMEGLTGGLNLVQADYDNDGDVDVLVLRGAWLDKAGRHPNSLIRNNGDGTFTDATFAAGLGNVHFPTQTAAWADYDNDGDVDLYVGNESTMTVDSGEIADLGYEAPTGINAPSQLFRNNGDGTFTDVGASAGVTNDRFTKAVVWGDYDNDRLPDIFVSNLGAANRLYHNNGDGTFTDQAEMLGVTEPIFSFPAWFWDFDNDGQLDLYVSSYRGTIAHMTAESLKLDYPAELTWPRLYRGNGRGGFNDVAERVALSHPTLPMGGNFGDLDNDGFLDFYLGTGDGSYKSLLPSTMYRNRGGTSFADITTAGGFGNVQNGHAVAFADFDNDVDQAVFEQMGGSARGDRFQDALFENPGFDSHWIAVDLVGVQSNRSGIGARIRVDVVEGEQSRAIYKHVNSGGSFGANPLRQAIGLGAADRIEQLTVYWPTTGRDQVFRDVEMDRFVRITEGEVSLHTLPLKRFALATQTEDSE